MHVWSDLALSLKGKTIDVSGISAKRDLILSARRNPPGIWQLSNRVTYGFIVGVSMAKHAAASTPASHDGEN